MAEMTQDSEQRTIEMNFDPRPSPAPIAIGGYEVLELVGRGGMGKVYRARHLELNRIVAIKVLAHEPDDKSLSRFLDEGRMVARLRHANIVQLYDLGLADSRPYLAQEYIDGGTLSQKFANTPQDPRSTAEVVEKIARAIHYSHENGILHRDLKPGNVLLTTDGQPKVTDFGLAKAIHAPGSTAAAGAGLTRTGEILGTPAYMPPEQASGVTANLGPTADVYALGAILYEGLTGRPPFNSPEPLQTVLMVLSADPVAPRALIPKLPRDLETICLKCLQKSPKNRYATAAALADDLERWRTGAPIVARPVGALERLGKWARRNKAQAALVAVTASLLFALVSIGALEAINAGRLREANNQLEAKNDELTRLNQDLEAAKQESDRSFKLATSALDGIVRDLALKLNGVPRAEAVLLEVISRSSELYGQLRSVRPDDASVTNSYFAALAMQIAYDTNYGRHEAGQRARAELKAELSKQLAITPGNAYLRRIQLRLAFDSATAAQARNQQDEANEAREEYIRLVDRFATEFASHPELPNIQVEKHWFRAFNAAHRQDTNGRISAIRDAVVAARAIALPQARFTLLSSSLSQLGLVLKMANHFDEADVAFQEVQAMYQQGTVDASAAEAHRAGLAETRFYRGGIALERGQIREALEHYQSAEPMARALIKDFPLTRSHRLTLSQCLYEQALIYQSQDRPRARQLMEEAVEVMEAQLKLRPDPSDKEVRDVYAQFRDSLPRPEKK